MITWLNVQEAAGMLAAMGIIFAGLWYGITGPAFRYLLHRVSRTRRETS